MKIQRFGRAKTMKMLMVIRKKERRRKEEELNNERKKNRSVIFETTDKCGSSPLMPHSPPS
jgi:hypothetical protein